MNNRNIIFPARNFLIRLRNIYESKYGQVSNIKFANEIGITKGILDRYIYRDSPIFDYLKGSALEKIVRKIFKNISDDLSWIDEKSFIEILSEYIEDEMIYIQKNNLNRNPISYQILEWINRKYKEQNTYYSTLDFIKDLVFELKIPHNELSILFGKDERFLDDIKQRIRNFNHQKYNPDYKFSLENLEFLENNLVIKYGNQACRSLYFIERYKCMNKDLKVYSSQQFHIHHPNLKPYYFSLIDTKKKAYWLGFLCADGYINKTRYGRMGIQLSIKDKEHLIMFCKAIGLNPLSIREREVVKKYKGKYIKYQTAEIDFWCKPMYEDLKNIKFKEFPKLSSNELYLAWLLGLYDGDGYQGKTMVCSASKNLLMKIKSLFNIEYEIRDYYYNDELEYYLRIKEGIEKDNCSRFLYVLTLGSQLFNKMMENFENSLRRKRKYFKTT